jgi:hypothetical protein
VVVPDERADEQVVEDPLCVAEVLAGRIEVVGEAEVGLLTDLERAAALDLGGGMR